MVVNSITVSITVLLVQEAKNAKINGVKII